jgi:Tol biopolymer transport system component
MRRGRRIVLPLALSCLMLGACGLRGPDGSRASGPDPRTAIALSVLADAVYVVDPGTGSRVEAVTGLVDYQSGYATWAPDHVHLAIGNDGIFAIDFETQAQRTILQGKGLSMPTWSPDGRSLAYGNGASLWIVPWSQGTRTQVAVPATLAPLDMDWGPEGGIAFAGLRRDCAADYTCPSTDQSDVWVVSPQVGRLFRLTRVEHAERPKWSPDGSRILFVRRGTGIGASGELWVMRANGSDVHRIGAMTDVLAADWSHDGRQLAIVRRGSAPRTLQVWIARDDASSARPVGTAVEGTDATIDW